MGGMNHQPCGRYLANSTRVSRFMSVAKSNLELANVALEDLILAELDGQIGDSAPIIGFLDLSKDNLESMTMAMHDLAQQMLDEGYADLPPMKTIDLTMFGREMRAAGLHRSESSWIVIAAMMQNSGFAPTLRHHVESTKHLVDLTDALKGRIVNAGEAVQCGQLSLALEENRAENFKPEFARLYTSWANFQQEFLASSMISTEVWYHFNQNGSLIDGNKAQRAA